MNTVKPVKSVATALLACLALGLSSGAFADEAGGSGELESLPGYGAQIAEKLFFDRVGGIAVDRNATPNHVYVTDTGNSRVLGWKDASALRNGARPDIVIGQPDFRSTRCNNGGLSAKSLCQPYGLAVDPAGNLFVADTGNNRVLEYNAPFINDRFADRVFGQDGRFDSRAVNHGGVSASSLYAPFGVAVDAGAHLYVADFGNNRVLLFEQPMKSAKAFRVLGQHGDFASAECNSGGISANSLCGPINLALDRGGNLFVAENRNNRVLEFDSPMLTDATAERVYGQKNFASSTANEGGPAAGLNFPSAVAIAIDGDLFVADSANNRVLRYRAPLNDSIPDGVIGQDSLTSTKCNHGGRGAASLCGPVATALDSADRLYVAEIVNRRVMRFNGGGVADLVLGQPDFNAGPQGLNPVSYSPSK